MSEDTCRYCKRPLAVCAVPVDETFPVDAQEAYFANHLEYALTCDRGQAKELELTRTAVRQGWNFSRVVYDPCWTGGTPPASLGELFVREWERRRPRRPRPRLRGVS